MEASLHKRFRRTLAILAHLQSGIAYSASDFSRHFRVSRRTIFRDIHFLREMGIPVLFDEDLAAYRLEEGSRLLPTPAFTAEDLSVLVVAAALSGSNRIPDLERRLREVIIKLLDVCPQSLRDEVTALLAACQLAPVPSLPAQPSAGVLLRVMEAIRLRKQLLVTLNDAGADTSPLALAPHGLTLSGARWTVTGHDPLLRSVRTIDICDIRDVDVTEQGNAEPKLAPLSAAATKTTQSAEPAPPEDDRVA